MSFNHLQDGTGSGKFLKIDSQNRARTLSTTIPLIDDVLVEDGKTFYASSGIRDFSAGGTTEYCCFEIYNNNTEDIMVFNFQMWLAPALTNITPGSYAEAADQWIRVNQWISPSVTMHDNGSAGSGILENLNAGSSEVFTGAVSTSNDTDAIAIPAKTSAEGYICGFKVKATGSSKIEMLPQPVILSKGDTLLISFKPTQYNTAASVVKHEFGFRASLVNLGSLTA